MEAMIGDGGSLPNRLFVVHGRNDGARNSMFEFLRALGLMPIEWSQAISLTGKASPYIGEILDVAFDRAQAVVVLLTPDEVTYLRSEYATGDEDPDLTPAAQARPNVLFEAGMAMGRSPDRTVLVEIGALRPFSDVFGRHVVRLDNSAQRRKDLAQRLISAGCSVDLTGEDWLTAGDFTAPSPPGAGLPLGRRIPPAPRPSRVSIDLRYHDRHNGGRLEIINIGTETVYDISLQLPPEASGFDLDNDSLPIKRLPAGKSVTLMAFVSKTLGSRHQSHFDVRVTGRTDDGQQVEQDVFLSIGA